ncbi:MAG TPA: YciI-like protein [Steroidobacter sp.]|jgi:hypothetical protein|nr:YciI-like protein [Steroidobacter sp.]
MHYLLFYEFTSDFLERRERVRAEHLKLAWDASERGELVLAGGYAEPVDGALLFFNCDAAETVERFAAADPYVRNGLVRRWFVRAWTTTVGEHASTPLRPG